MPAGLAHGLRTKLSRVAPGAPEGPDGQSIQMIQFFNLPVLLVFPDGRALVAPIFCPKKAGLRGE